MTGATYRTYGLTLSSDVDLPLPPADATADPDVSVELAPPGTSPVSAAADGAPAVVERDGRRTVHLAYDRLGAMVVEADRIRVVPRPGVGAQTVAGYVLGVGVATLLWLRGHLVLHASAVLVDGRVVAFLGEAGAGKSTTAAAFARRGAGVLADDVLPVTPGDPPLVAPGPPLLKLDPAMASRVAAATVARGVERPGADGEGEGPRRQFYRFEGVTGERHRPAALYALSAGETTRVDRLPPREAAFALVENTYPRSLFDDDARSRSLDRCTGVAGRVPVYRLTRPRDPDRLAAVVSAVRESLDDG